jgi:hypothetical protein
MNMRCAHKQEQQQPSGWHFQCLLLMNYCVFINAQDMCDAFARGFVRLPRRRCFGRRDDPCREQLFGFPRPRQQCLLVQRKRCVRGLARQCNCAAIGWPTAHRYKSISARRRHSCAGRAYACRSIAGRQHFAALFEPSHFRSQLFAQCPPSQLQLLLLL